MGWRLGWRGIRSRDRGPRLEARGSRLEVESDGGLGGQRGTPRRILSNTTLESMR